jgi:FMN phosphatase YigB (HAD superfamily)
MTHLNRHFKAVFFDLDGTLLDSSMETFLPPYLKHISARIAGIMAPQEFVAQLLRATELMAANDGRATNEEVFAAAFYPAIGRSRAEMEPIFEAFYAEDFPKLQQYTRRKPEARPVVQRVFGLGYDVAVTTNPLFPATAVMQRLAWAGVDDFPYRLVTTYENSRFCKPNPRYFEDVAGRLGRLPGECLVVGDEAMDMAGALAGCPTFLVESASTRLGADTPEPTYRGTLEDVLALLEE